MSKETIHKLQQIILKKETELRDLSEVCKQQLHTIQQLTEFLSNMRHDTRMPLSGIVGFSEILKSESKEPHIKAYADNLVAASHDLLELLNEVLDDEVMKTALMPQMETPLKSINTSGLNSFPRVLVVEDNIIAQTVAQSVLVSLSCRVDTASNGHEAIELSNLNHYDLIFMDIGLGEGIDGFDVTRYIRNISQPKHHIPIIALTAHAGNNTKQRCIEAGMDEVLSKPLTQSQAINIIKTFIPIKQDKTLMTLMLAKKELPENNRELFNLEQYPLFDPEAALKNCGNNDVLVELLGLMISQEIPEEEQRIKRAFENKDYHLVEKIAHKIKSGAMYLGTTRMKFACQYVERYWKTGERELFNDLYHQAVKTIDDTSKYISEWLSKQPTL